MDPGYEQGMYYHMEPIFGVKSGDMRAIQDVGHVLTKQGRMVVFPNVLQYVY